LSIYYKCVFSARRHLRTRRKTRPTNTCARCLYKSQHLACLFWAHDSYHCDLSVSNYTFT